MRTRLRRPPLRTIPRSVRAHMDRAHGTRFVAGTTDAYIREVHRELHESGPTRHLASHRHRGMG